MLDRSWLTHTFKGQKDCELVKEHGRKWLDGEPDRVTSRKPHESGQKSCPLGQMLSSDKEEASDRAIRGKSLGTTHGQISFL